MKQVLIFILGILIYFQVPAQYRVSKAEAQAKAATFARNTSFIANLISRNEMPEILCVSENGDTLLYLVKYEKLSVIVSGVKNMPPILGCSHFVADNVEEYFRQPGSGYYLSRYLEYSRTAMQNRIMDISPKWLDTEHDTSNRIQYLYIEPLVSTQWGQSISNCGHDNTAYNNLITEQCEACESDVSPVGCVAVAMGQIMNYYKYPIVRWDKPASSQFDWCNMPSALYYTDSDYEKKKKAVAYLLKECGNACDMTYCYLNDCQSFAWPHDARDAFVDDFSYSEDAVLKRRFFYNDSEWKSMLVGQLESKQPVFYASLNEEETDFMNFGGHAYICDGYDEESGLFHFNFGWRGTDDGWYDIDNLITETHQLNMNIFERAIFNIYPPQDNDFCNFTLPLELYYYWFYTLLENNTPPTYMNVPTNASVLYSVSNASSNPLMWRTIPVGATTEYVAHEKIVLQPGFKAEYGSNFTARIESCNNCENRNGSDEMIVPDASMDSTENRMRIQNSVINYLDTVLVPTASLLVFPNPTREKLTVSVFDNPKDIFIYDMVGKSVFRWFIASKAEGQLVLDVSKLISGTYILKIETDKGLIQIGRFIKE